MKGLSLLIKEWQPHDTRVVLLCFLLAVPVCAFSQKSLNRLETEVEDTIRLISDNATLKKRLRNIRSGVEPLERSVKGSSGREYVYTGKQSADGTRVYISVSNEDRAMTWSEGIQISSSETVKDLEGNRIQLKRRLPTREEFDTYVRNRRDCHVEYRTEGAASNHSVTVVKGGSNRQKYKWLQFTPDVNSGQVVGTPLYWLADDVRFNFGKYWMSTGYDEDSSRALCYVFNSDGHGVLAELKSSEACCRVVVEMNINDLRRQALQSLLADANASLAEQRAREEAERQRQIAIEEAERQRQIDLRLNALDSVPLLRLLRGTVVATESDVSLFDYTIVPKEGGVKILVYTNKRTSAAYKEFWKEANQVLDATSDNNGSPADYDFSITNSYAEFASKAAGKYYFMGKQARWAGKETSVGYHVRLDGSEDAYAFEMMDSLKVAVDNNLLRFVSGVFGAPSLSAAVINPLIPTPDGTDYDHLDSYGDGQGRRLLGFGANREGEVGRWYIPHLQNDWDSGLPLYEIVLTGIEAADKKSILAAAKELGYDAKVKEEEMEEASSSSDKAKKERGSSLFNVRVNSNSGNGRPRGGNSGGGMNRGRMR